MKLIVSGYPFAGVFLYWYKQLFNKSSDFQFPIVIEADVDTILKFHNELLSAMSLVSVELRDKYEFELIENPDPHLIKAQLWFDNLPPLEQTYVKTLIRQNERR